MADYTFKLDWFKITDTRSHHNDTDVAGLAVVVNGTVYGPLVAGTGDVNNGTFFFQSKNLGSLTNVTINDGDKFAFVYAIYNNGNSHHPNGAELSQYIVESATAAIKNATSQLDGIHKADDPEGDGGGEGDDDDDDDDGGDGGGGGSSGGSWRVVYDILTGGLYDGLKYVLKDCDGPVALGSLSGDGASLAQLMATSGGVYSQADQCNAKKLHFGTPCNSSGSNYVVAWTVGQQRTAPKSVPVMGNKTKPGGTPSKAPIKNIIKPR